MEKWARLLYQPTKPLSKEGLVTASAKHIALSREAAEEGIVLLKNENNCLPLKKNSRIALFGKASFDYVKGGGGSGDVYCEYVHNLYEGLCSLNHVKIYEPLAEYYHEYVNKQYAKGAAPGMISEPSVSEITVLGARAFSDTAVLVLSRFSGEGWDRSTVEYEVEYNPWEVETSMPKLSGEIFPDGDFNLTYEERSLFSQIKQVFPHIIVVLNIGGVISLAAFKEEPKVEGILLGWQGGMEGGDAIAAALCGLVNPSGKLPDTFADSVEAYPSTEKFHESPHYVDYEDDIYVGYRYFETFSEAKQRVCYPFGYGRSYTSFSYTIDSCFYKCIEHMSEEYTKESPELPEGSVEFQVTVTNTGECSGKEVIQVYYHAPDGLLGKPALELGAFEKTRLLMPGDSQTLTLSIPRYALSSYDDLGKIQKSAYLLEAGTYEFFVGTSSRELTRADYELTLSGNLILEQLQSHCAPSSLSRRLLSNGSYEDLPQTTANDPDASAIPKMLPGSEEGLVPAQRSYESYMLLKPFGKENHTLIEVANKKLSLDEFVKQLSDEDLMHLCGGQPNTGVANTWGFGNLPEYGVPSAMTADGPAGLRLHEKCGVCTTAWPCATLLAATWNPALVERVGAAGGAEVKENNIAIWLTPAVNIHRNPLCGRNFEYYSEDPLLAGKMGAAMVRGIQSNHIAASVKHFAANNKETNRKQCDSRVSERALREIYLKVFEIIVKESNPWTIMSSYNPINGHRSSENKDLLTGILREEWGFSGMVTTDWWTRGEHYKEILAGNDIKMACGFPERIQQAMDLGAIERSDIEKCAKRVLELLLKFD